MPDRLLDVDLALDAADELARDAEALASGAHSLDLYALSAALRSTAGLVANAVALHRKDLGYQDKERTNV